MKNRCLFFGGIFFSLLSSLYAIDLPADEFVSGWRRFEATMVFAHKDLYGYIDGGAELFFEFGFSDLQVQRYRCGERELSLDVYQMTGPDAALAIYLAKKGEEQPVPNLPGRNTGGDYQITALKGRFFVQVNNQTGEAENFPIMVKLMHALLQQVPAESARDWFLDLPSDRIPGSELLIAGPYSLQMIYTLGQGDVLQLAGKQYGVCVETFDEQGFRYTMIRVAYPDEAAAVAALAHLVAHLDEYLVVIQSKEDLLSFRDYQNQYGRVVRMKNVLELRLHLPSL